MAEIDVFEQFSSWLRPIVRNKLLLQAGILFLVFRWRGHRVLAKAPTPMPADASGLKLQAPAKTWDKASIPFFLRLSHRLLEGYDVVCP